MNKNLGAHTIRTDGKRYTPKGYQINSAVRLTSGHYG